MLRLAGIWLLCLITTIVLLFATARAYDYEQVGAKFKPRIGRALFCTGVPPQPVLCSYHGSREIRWYLPNGIL